MGAELQGNVAVLQYRLIHSVSSVMDEGKNPVPCRAAVPVDFARPPYVWWGFSGDAGSSPPQRRAWDMNRASTVSPSVCVCVSVGV